MTREEQAAQADREKEAEDNVLDVLNEVFAVYEEEKK